MSQARFGRLQSHIERIRLRAIATLGLCIVLASALALTGCGRRETLELDVRPYGETVAVGQTVTFTLWNDTTGTEEDPGHWHWVVIPEKGATCTRGQFTATVPGVYDISVIRDSWNSSEQPYKVSEARITVEEEVASEVHYHNHNDQAVQNNGTPPTFELIEELMVTSIETYHWNDAAGVSETGEISLQAEDGTVYGPWATEGREGQGGVPNAYWTAVPDIELPPGDYTVLDSDPSTWAQNSGTGGQGMVRISVETEE